MKYYLSLILICAGLHIHAQTGIYIPELAKFDTAMLDLMKQYNVPGGQLAISKDGRLVYNRAFGLANVSSGDSVIPSSKFRIASVSKPITSVACMYLFEKGKLSLDARVFGTSGILNDAPYQTMLDPRDTQITVRMLLQHSGGWNSSVSGDPMFKAYQIATAMGTNSPPDEITVISYVLKNQMLDFKPGTQYQYSNLGYCILGRVIEKITGKSYRDFVQQEILAPMGIYGMQLGKNLESNRLPNEVHYYDYPGAALAKSVYNNTDKVPFPYGGYNLEYMDAHGGWISNAEDLTRFICAIDRFSSFPDFLEKATIDSMVKPSVNNKFYANGFSVNTANNWWHNGSLPGTTAEIVRYANGGMNWTILFNTRDRNFDINEATDQLVWSVLPYIKSWPSHDLFGKATVLVQNNKKLFHITVFPNPANQLVNIHMPEKLADCTIRVLDIYGHALQELHAKNCLNKSISTANLKIGVYYIEVKSQGKRWVEKLIVER